MYCTKIDLLYIPYRRNLSSDKKWWFFFQIWYIIQRQVKCRLFLTNRILLQNKILQNKDHNALTNILKKKQQHVYLSPWYDIIKRTKRKQRTLSDYCSFFVFKKIAYVRNGSKQIIVGNIFKKKLCFCYLFCFLLFVKEKHLTHYVTDIIINRCPSANISNAYLR